MKRNLFLGALLAMTCAVFAQQPVITFTKTEHDFGKINEADGRVSTVFEFKNEGMEPLVLTNVRASCGCTTPTWTKTPVEPGQTGNITVTYNPNGRPGRFQKTITITSNATEPTKKVFIKGEVIPKQAKPVAKYPVKMGDLSIASHSVNFGHVMHGKQQVKTIEYANLTDGDVTVDVVRNEEDPILVRVSLPTLKKGETGQIEVYLSAEGPKQYGPLQYEAYVIVNGKRQLSDEFKLTISANVDEDFSALTPEQRQNAPIVEVAETVDLGTIVPGKKTKHNISFANVGADPLLVRAVVNNATDFFRVSANKQSLKSGKKGALVIEMDGKLNGNPLKAGAYHRSITLITNDPKNPKKVIHVNWTIAE